MTLHKTIVPWLLTLAAGSWASADAAVVHLDEFVVTRNGTTFFADPFDDGAPPPAAPNFPNAQPASYSVLGTFPAGSESAGRLRLDSANGALTQNANQAPRRTLRAGLNTNVDSSDLTTGLKIDDTLSLTGLFDLDPISGPLVNGYSIRFSDRAAGLVNQIADLVVRFNPVSGKVEITYNLQDFAANQIIEAGRADFDPPGGADQIRLQITRPDTTNTNFFASYSYLQAGSVVGGGAFATPISLFQGENFVRAEFIAFESLPAVVPEPGTLTLLGVGIALVVALRRRRR
jgi:hypothetical protein